LFPDGILLVAFKTRFPDRDGISQCFSGIQFALTGNTISLFAAGIFYLIVATFPAQEVLHCGVATITTGVFKKIVAAWLGRN